jgi:spermidine/putrescine transport system substrate-binding protein
VAITAVKAGERVSLLALRAVSAARRGPMQVERGDPLMAMHPRERTSYDRRQFLRYCLAVSAGTVVGPSLLSACQGSASSSSGGETALPMARPNHPVTLPTFADIPRIKSGLKPEKGPLQVFNYADYLAPGVLKAFGDKYGTSVEVTTFNSMDEAVSKLRTGQTNFDVFFPTPDVLAKVVLGKLLQPLNYSYLPNLHNALSELQNPFYDRGPRYTVPYNIYSTGIGYRADEVPGLPPNGWDIIWDPKYAGGIHVLDDGREAIGMSLLRNGVTDVNTEDPKAIHAAGDQLDKLVSTVNVKVDINGYTQVPENRATIHQCWSGDMISAQYYLPKGESVDVLGYWRPDRGAVVGSDTIAVTAGATNPVLAHLFLNYLLDDANALRNFGWVGYQPALAKFTPQFLSDQGYVPKNLKSTVVTLADYHNGHQLLQLSPTGRALWDDVWASFKAG